MPENVRAWNSLDIQLINFVKQHPVFYDPDVQSVVGQSIRAKGNNALGLGTLWNTFAKETGRSAKKCEVRWRYIYQHYLSGKAHPSSKYNDGTLSFLDFLVEKIRPYRKPQVQKIITIPGAQITKPIEPKFKPKWSREMLLNTTVVTQDMIEEVIKLKTEEERTFSTEYGPASSPKTESDRILFKSIASFDLATPDPDSIKIQNTLLSTIIQKQNTVSNEQETNVANNENLPSTAQCSKEGNDNSGINNVEFFEDMGTYVTNHLPVNQQKQLRLMLWSLITEEKKGMSQEE